MKWTPWFLLTLCCCAQGASFISRYLDLIFKLNVFTKLRPNDDPGRWQFNGGNKNLSIVEAISETSTTEESASALENDAVVQAATDNAALQNEVTSAANDVPDAQSDSTTEPTQPNVIETNDDYEEDYDPSLFIEDEARSHGKRRPANRRTKRTVPFMGAQLFRNDDYDVSNENSDF